ncbi:putative CDP-diacylglycerol--glycerol-3-phosphate 1-phosphatidyltransferase [Helianthus annuus]|nr:putative CDP-diacylglycerol--glycerol-3-phosphate 1-phosphatidyltransferase [Helianthus annuus]KAJ0487275.1 putative CDP-diacylglycerol--glycerol-3-phosphate 1-phosphatidyltransferase [Helianthus annuus]
MPLNLLKLTSSIYLHNHHHHHHQWLRRAITTGKPRTPLQCSGWCRITQFAPQSHAINHNDNINNRDRGSSGLPTLPANENGHLKPHPSQQNPSAKLLTLPTILTIARVASVPLLISTFYMDSRFGTNATTCIFIAASVTDWLDGYLARRMNLGTAFGAFLDPVADKLMVAATLVLLCTRPPEAAIFGQLPWLLTVPAIAIIGREITMSAVREWAASQGSKLSEAVAVNNLGKWKTATQMIALTILLVIRDSSFTEAGFLGATGVGFLYISAMLAVWSLVVYMKKIWRVMLM